MKLLKTYREEIMLNKSSPHFLADISLELGGDYAFYQELYAEMEISKAAFMTSNQGSISSKEYSFIVTEEGKRWERLKRKIKGIEGLQKGLVNINITNSIEARISK